MSLDIQGSIKNLLENMTQEQINLWLELDRKEVMPKEVFVSKFNDFSKEGLASLMSVISMEKAERLEEDDKLYKLCDIVEQKMEKGAVLEDEMLKLVGTRGVLDDLLPDEGEK